MTQALFTAMTGLNAGTEQLTVVSDNVANMNTTAYKTSRVDFQDIWYQTKTTGTNSTAVSGGTNPYQVGVGVKCASITKDFGASSINTTGRTEDMALQGDGWFTVINSDGAVMLTRDGTFALDENGYICTASGCKVLGMSEITSDSRTTIPMKIPTSIKVIEEPTEADKFKNMTLDNLNNANITSGYFYATVSDGAGNSKRLQIFISPDANNDAVPDDTPQNLLSVSGIVGNMTVGREWDPTTEKWKDGTIDVSQYIGVGYDDGVITFEPKGGYNSIIFESGGSSNFVKQTQLGSAKIHDDGEYAGKYITKPLDISAEITEADDVTADTTKVYKSFSVGLDGLVTVTYSDNSTLSVNANADGDTFFSYTNAEGVIINSDPGNTRKESLYIDPNTLVKANMQMQFAKVTNNGGLVSVGNNMYDIGVNCGQVIYSAANYNGIGAVTTGALESSNVDLAQQFSNMILAQRLVQANSQVFSGANTILETLVYLGR